MPLPVYDGGESGCPTLGGGSASGQSRPSAGSRRRDVDAARLHRLLVEPPCTVRRPHERTAEDAGEADLLGLGRHLHELLRLDPPLDGVVARGRAEVLGDGDQLATRSVQVDQGLVDLLAGLAHAQDQVAVSYTHLTLPTIYSV